ncbi:MAG: tRNA (adenosine(37)-N6)-dimethylallyltransferase MiaA [Buchnera aphidicola (Eriosoma harunire)]
MGTTASGKTSLAFDLRQILPIDIISVDSGLIYRDMNIGTDKPSSEELLKHPHDLVNIVDPVDIYSVANFKFDSSQAIQRIICNHRIPILVGGTMLYYKVLLNGLINLPSSNHIFQSKIQKYIHQIKKITVHQYLHILDSRLAQTIHPNNVKKTLRAIEITLHSKKALNLVKNKSYYHFPYKLFQFFLMPFTRKILHDRIECRFHNMLKMGLEKEVKQLFLKYELNVNMPSMQRLGYREMCLYLSNQCTYDEMIYKSISSTRQFAKRQITWSKKWDNLFILNSENREQSISIIKNIIDKYITIN